LGVIIQDGKWGIVNKQGQSIIKPRFGFISGISIVRSELILAFEKDLEEVESSEWYYFDRNGNIVFYSETVGGKRVVKNAKGDLLWE
jgi:hypothetical protein